MQRTVYCFQGMVDYAILDSSHFFRVVSRWLFGLAAGATDSER
jgi:hypothetical protein